MILEFVSLEEPDDSLAFVPDGAAVPRKGDVLHIQTAKREPFTQYVVDHVEWQLDADYNYSAIVVVRLPSGFGD